MNIEILYTVRDGAVGLRKKLKIKENTSSCKSAVHDIKNRKDFYLLFTSAVRQLFLTPVLTTDIYKQYTAVCPLLPAATIRRVLF